MESSQYRRESRARLRGLDYRVPRLQQCDDNPHRSILDSDDFHTVLCWYPKHLAASVRVNKVPADGPRGFIRVRATDLKGLQFPLSKNLARVVAGKWKKHFHRRETSQKATSVDLLTGWIPQGGHREDSAGEENRINLPPQCLTHRVR